MLIKNKISPQYLDLKKATREEIGRNRWLCTNNVNCNIFLGCKKNWFNWLVLKRSKNNCRKFRKSPWIYRWKLLWDQTCIVQKKKIFHQENEPAHKGTLAMKNLGDLKYKLLENHKISRFGSISFSSYPESLEIFDWKTVSINWRGDRRGRIFRRPSEISLQDWNPFMRETLDKVYWSKGILHNK